MFKNSPFLLLSGVAAAFLLGGCSKNDADTTDTTPSPPVSRRPKTGADAAKPGVPGTPKSPQTAAAPTGSAAKPGAKGDPFKPGSGNPGATANPVGGPKTMPGKGNVAGGPGKPGVPAQGRPGMPGARPGAPGKPGMPGQTGSSGVAGTKLASVPKSTRDPFFIDWHKQPPPPYVFDQIQGPLLVASESIDIPPAGEITLREVANRRVSGIMSGDGVFAILETAGGGETEIVKPGSQTKDGYRVVAITEDSVKLQRRDGNVLRTQEVPLTDQSLGGQSSGGMSGFGAPRGGMPTSGGMSGGPTGGGRKRPGMSSAGGGGGASSGGSQ